MARTGPSRVKPAVSVQNADLHCHSNQSDGVLEPRELVQRAHRNGVDLFSLTDHDLLSGLQQAADEATGLGLRFVPGVEISVTWGQQTVHVLGLNIDPVNAALADGLAGIRSGRRERARQIAEQLEQAGIPGAFNGALAQAGNDQLISRTHFARHIVSVGTCQSVNEVFSRYLTEGRPGFVPHRWASLDDSLAWIAAAGGDAVLAHPGRYRMGQAALSVLIERFKDCGGKGIEVVCGSHRPDQYASFASQARRFGLRASRGSDFHAPGEGRVDLGGLPQLPDDLVPVWQDWQ
ncbi:MAG: 3',5'-nucleoside bisphosphate phosphatase [Quisquiliibacterium sp.]